MIDINFDYKVNKYNWTKVIVLNHILLNYAYHQSVWDQLSITGDQKLNDKDNTNKTENLAIDFNEIYKTKSINEIAEMLNLWTQNNNFDRDEYLKNNACI